MQLALPIAAAAVLLAKKLRDATDRDKRREAILDEVCSVIVAAAVAAASRRLKLDRPLQLQYRELFNTPVLRLHALRDAVVEQMEAGLAGQVGTLLPSPSLAWILLACTPQATPLPCLATNAHTPARHAPAMHTGCSPVA
jgi:hypothetical protein